LRTAQRRRVARRDRDEWRKRVIGQEQAWAHGLGAPGFRCDVVLGPRKLVAIRDILVT
jgi:hypothetical protein